MYGLIKQLFPSYVCSFYIHPILVCGPSGIPIQREKSTTIHPLFIGSFDRIWRAQNAAFVNFVQARQDVFREKGHLYRLAFLPGLYYLRQNVV